MRKIILSILGILLIVGAILIGNYFITKNNKPKPSFKKTVKTVFVDVVKNKEIPIIITASGNLIAKNKIEIYSEVQGILNQSNKPFKAGTRYNKAETLLSVNNDEFNASLKAQKSNLYNAIIAMIPDLRLDYPNQFKKWEVYAQNFDMNKTTPIIPEFSTDKEKYFISGRGITTAYYTVKNLEVRLAKHQIKAPFSGVLTQTMVTPGTLIRVGQKLGEFISTNVYEMEVSVNTNYADLLEVGNKVSLANLERNKTYVGVIVRVNASIDQTSQTVKAYIEVSDTSLKEGMFLVADLVAKSEKEAVEISRKLLVNNTSVFTVVNDSILRLQKVKPVYFDAETVVVKGLKDDTEILTQTLPGAFDGMIVNINKEK